MLTIGEFSRLGSISIRMLRHYDEIGLLAPAQVDAATGYRSHSIAQLRDLNRIVALRGTQGGGPARCRRAGPGLAGRAARTTRAGR
jgi:DNA-binding transcriptional MerR regulator